MEVLKPYSQLWDRNIHKALLKSGRTAGKSTSLFQLITEGFFEFPNLDIIVCRSNYGDLQKSVYAGILKYMRLEGLEKYVETRTRPLKIISKTGTNVIHFEGVGGSDLERSKGLEPKNKVSLIVIDETQQLPKQENLDQALATFRRHLDLETYQIVLAFNPKRQNSHWLNEYFRVREDDPSWLTLHTTYKDIAKKLTPFDIQEIREEMKYNPSNYRFLYLGETEGLFGGVYFSFNRDFHLLKEKVMKKLIKEIGIHSILIGVDGATTIDKTAFIPTVILKNGQGLVLNYFYQDPEKNGALSNDKLFPYVRRWLDDLFIRWNIPFNRRVDLIFDSANPDLRMVCADRLPSNFVCSKYSQKNVIQMAQIMQNAFSRNVLYILQEDVYNWMSNRREYNVNPLVQQLESVIWDEKGKGFDPSIPNDATDALTYSTAFYFRNPNALYFPKRESFYEKEIIDAYK
jgi:PBSX family phage terminase large subunit